MVAVAEGRESRAVCYCRLYGKGRGDFDDAVGR